MIVTPANTFPMLVVVCVVALVVAVAVKSIIAWINDRDQPHE